MSNFNAAKVKDDIIQWIKDWFEENGKDCNAVIGVSGGIDSSVVTALCVEVLGKDRVIGVLMPHGTQPDIDVAIDLCKYLDIEYCTINIHKPFLSIKHQVKEQLNDMWTSQSSINLAPRLRMSILYAVSQSVNGRVANTSNLSESYVGWDTRYGDSVGDFSPLFNLTKTEVKAIGKELGLPDKFVNKTPEDGLCGKTDEDKFGFTYNVLDKYIRTGEIDDMDVKNKIDVMHKKNLFKLKPMPAFKYKGE